MRPALLLLVVACACDPVWSVRARVRGPDGAPLRDAALAITCRPDGTGRAALTDDAGEAVIGGLGWELPAGCAVTVARPGYRTHRVTVEELCAPKPVADCDRARALDVVLAR